MEFKGALINGDWEFQDHLDQISVINPCNGQKIGSISACDGNLANKALKTAQESFTKWSKLSIDQRAKFILDFKSISQ